MAVSRLWGRSVGMIAGLMMAGYAPGVFFDGVVQKASLAGLATSGLIATISWAVFDSRRRATLAMGVMCGLVCLLREQALVWIPFLCLWVFFGRPSGTLRPRWYGMATCLLGIGLVLFPVGVGNRIVSKEWSFSTFQAGPNFYIGNHAEAGG